MHTSLFTIVALGIGLMLLRPRGIAEVWWAGGAAVLLAALRLIPLRAALHAVVQGTDVYLFLFGMMLLAALAREHGVFDWASSFALTRARAHPARLFAYVYGVGTVVTVFLSNDATAVVLTPAVLAVAKKAETDPEPHLFACALVANAASFVLPISNPANLVVFHNGLPPLGRWIAAFALPSVASIAATYAVLRFAFRKQLTGTLAGAVPVPLRPGGKLVLGGLVLVVTALLAASAWRLDLGLPTALAALAVAAAVSLQTRRSPFPLFREISWSTLLLVAALFVLVEAVETAGALGWAQQALRGLAGLPASRFAVAGAVGVANNLVNNLPLGLLAGSALHAAPSLANTVSLGVLLGVDLGPNLSVTGSLATILWLLAIQREGVRVSALGFLKVGALAMPIALASAVAASLLRR